MATPEQLFTEIFEANHRAVHAYLLGRVGDRELARDLVQETFLRVWRWLDEVAALPSERRQAWIFTVARNLATDTHRSRATRDATIRALDVTAQAESAAAENPETRVQRDELLEELGEAVRALPEDLRVVLAMRVVGELTSAEIGAALGQPAGTVRYKLAKARRALAERLQLVEPEVGESG